MKVSQDKVRGMFLGIAIGDALYMPVETWSAEQIADKHGRLTSYIRPDGHKWFDGRDAGTWTDDTQLTLVVAESLIAKGKIDLDDLASRHVESLRKDGDRGFGGTTREAIKNLASGVHWSKSGKSKNPKHGIGNGMTMKVAPLGAFRASAIWSELWVEERSKFIDNLVHFTLMTHNSKMAVESTLAHVYATDICLNHDPIKDFPLESFFKQIIKMSDFINYRSPTAEPELTLTSRLEMLRRFKVESLTQDVIISAFDSGTSYVYDSLPFSYAFLIRNPRSIETLYDVGNAGGDTDTNASIVGGLLGALNGTSIFPQHLIDGLWQKERIIDTADRFYDRFFIINPASRKATKDKEGNQ